MDYNEIRDKIFDAARNLEDEEVIKTVISGFNVIVTRDNVLIKVGDEWMFMSHLLHAMVDIIEVK